MKERHALTTGLGFRPGEGKESTGTDFLFKASPDVGFFWLQQTQLGGAGGTRVQTVPASGPLVSAAVTWNLCPLRMEVSGVHLGEHRGNIT